MSTVSAFESELINKLQFKASSKVSPDALLFKTFKFFDLYNNGYLNKADFFRAIAKCGVIVDTHNLDQLFDHYATQKDGKIYYKEFIEDLLFRGSQSSLENRSSVSEKTSEKAMEKPSKPEQNPLVTNPRNQPYQNHSQKSHGSKKSQVDDIYTHGDTPEEILDHIRKQIRKDGLAGIFQFANKLKSYDSQKTHVISSHKLKQVLPYLTTQQIKRVIQQFNPTPQGQINYAQLIYSLKGSVDKQVEVLINNTFIMLDEEKARELEINKIIDHFKGENKAELIKAINGYCKFQGIQDGYFTDEDFIDFSQFVSFFHANNQKFRTFITKGFFEEQDRKSNKSNRSRPRQYQKQSSQYKNEGQEGDFRKMKSPHGQPIVHYEDIDRKQVKNFNEEDQCEKKSVSRHSHSSQGKLKTSNVKQVELIMLRIKKRLASKGSRGFLLFEKALKTADSNNDGCVNLEEFLRVIKDQRVDITQTQARIVFDVFNEQSTGAISYPELLYTLKGDIPENRKAIMERIWRRVKKTEEYTTFSSLKQNINLRGHPDIQNGRRYDEEILKQMQETILLIQDLNNSPRSEEISKDEFFQYLENCSLATPEDQLFECIAQNFWRMDPDVRIEDRYAGSRKLFDPKSKSYLMDHHRQNVKGGSVTDNAPYGTFAEPTVYLTQHRKL